jgi:hypothetical protein
MPCFLARPPSALGGDSFGSFATLALAGWLLAGTWGPTARADGGTVRLSERRGGYQITVFTAPTPFRAGPVDISVLVQDAATGEPLPQTRVTIRATPRGRPEDAIRFPATTEPATNKLFQAAVFDLPEPGWWEVEVAVEGTRGPTQMKFDLEAAEPLPQWLTLWPWFTWPALAILLFAIHQRLVRRRPWSFRAAAPAASGQTKPPRRYKLKPIDLDQLPDLPQ